MSAYGDSDFGTFAFGGVAEQAVVRTLPSFATFPVALSYATAPVRSATTILSAKSTTASLPMIATFAVFHSKKAVPSG